MSVHGILTHPSTQERYRRWEELTFFLCWGPEYFHLDGVTSQAPKGKWEIYGNKNILVIRVVVGYQLKLNLK